MRNNLPVCNIFQIILCIWNLHYAFNPIHLEHNKKKLTFNSLSASFTMYKLYTQSKIENRANVDAKRVFDILFASTIIIFVLSWLIPLIGIIIKLDSKGSILFKQLRTGKHGHPFYCLKFRSMGASTDADSRQATQGDVRVTRVGAFLRKTSLDELPQFINVLLGEMSVVGPRPHMLKHTEDYAQVIENFMDRHLVTPGITGWAQVSGHRGETNETSAMAKRVNADIWYLENRSFLLDLQIVLRTVNCLRGDEKAY